jgi:hypothetical protein
VNLQSESQTYINLGNSNDFSLIMNFQSLLDEVMKAPKEAKFANNSQIPDQTQPDEQYNDIQQLINRDISILPSVCNSARDYLVDDLSNCPSDAT